MVPARTVYKTLQANDVIKFKMAPRGKLKTENGRYLYPLFFLLVSLLSQLDRKYLEFSFNADSLTFNCYLTCVDPVSRHFAFCHRKKSTRKHFQFLSTSSHSFFLSIGSTTSSLYPLSYQMPSDISAIVTDP